MGHELYFGKEQHTTHETKTTIVSIPVTTPKESIIKMNEQNLRYFAKKSVPRRAINLIKDGVMALDWRISTVKPGDKRTYTWQKKALENILKNPNQTDNWTSFGGQMLEDLLIGDRGCAELVFTGSINKPIDLFPVNGFAIQQVRGWFDDPTMPRFKQVISGGYNEVFLNDEDLIFLQKNGSTESPFGLSPLEQAFQEIVRWIEAAEYAGKQASNAIPKNALDLGENISATDLVSFRKYMREEVYGLGEMAIIGGTKGAKSMKLGAIGDEELYLGWQNHLIMLIALCFNIDPKKLGQGSNTDRSTVQEQNDSMLKEAIKPNALLLQDAINKKIIERLGLAEVLKFEFIFEDTLDQKKQKQKLIEDKWTSGALTYEEYRDALLLPKVDSKYAKMTQPEMKAAINKDYAVQIAKNSQSAGGTGGFNGLGINRKEDVPKKRQDGEN